MRGDPAQRFLSMCSRVLRIISSGSGINSNFPPYSSSQPWLMYLRDRSLSAARSGIPLTGEEPPKITYPRGDDMRRWKAPFRSSTLGQARLRGSGRCHRPTRRPPPSGSGRSGCGYCRRKSPYAAPEDPDGLADRASQDRRDPGRPRRAAGRALRWQSHRIRFARPGHPA